MGLVRLNTTSGKNQSSNGAVKFGKNSYADIFSTESDQPYKEGKQNPLASPGVKATTNLNFHNRSENSNHGEHLESRH